MKDKSYVAIVSEDVTKLKVYREAIKSNAEKKL